MKILYCSDLGFHCNHIIRERTEEEVLQHASEHALQVHHVSITPEMADQMKEMIKEEEQPIKTYSSPESC